jgi:hypothetical protein
MKKIGLKNIAVHRLRVLIGCLPVLLLLVLLACSPQNAHPIDNPVDDGTHREALIEAYRATRTMLFVYGTGDSSASKEYRALLAGMGAAGSRMKLIVRSDREVTDAELHAHALYLIGTPQNNAVLKRLLPQLPFAVTAQTLDFNQHQYGDHPTLSLGFYPTPLAPDLPLSLTTGVHEADVLAQVRKTFGQAFYWFALGNWGYELQDGGRRKVMGFFDESDPKQWKIGKKTHWDFSDDGVLAMETEAIEYYDHQSAYSPSIADSITVEQKLAWGKLQQQFGWKMPTGKAQFHLYPTAELKGLATGDSKPSQLDMTDGSIHFVVHEEHAGRENIAGNTWLIRKQLGESKMPQLELGLSVWATTHWQKAGWQTWAKRWSAHGEGLRIAELMDPDIWAHESPYLKECMMAALVDFLISQWGNGKFLAFYETPDPAQILVLESAFEIYLNSLPDAPKFYVDHRLPAFHKAFNFAHEGYQIFNGYLSAEASRSLTYTAQQLGCNATAVIPYAGMADVHAPAWLDFSEGAGAENDESIVHCIWSAKQAGMQVMIKPQVWPWNDWTGEVAMQNEGDWQLFFERYFRWIRHYAMMAELYDADILCIGVEFSKATLARPDDWRKMITRLRTVYNGKMTYAANWGDEFEQLSFWDALDFVGVNCYYPISKKDKPKQKELNDGFAEVVDKVERVAEKAQKPVLFTEIGFRSCTTPWANPHAEADGRAIDDAAQAACYQAMIAGLAGKSWCQGIYLWKWPAYMADAQFDPTGFTPLGKPAEQLVRDWFGRR